MAKGGKPVVIDQKERDKIVSLYTKHFMTIKDLALRFRPMTPETVREVLTDAGIEIKSTQKRSGAFLSLQRRVVSQ